jgi:hypothetical protein
MWNDEIGKLSKMQKILELVLDNSGKATRDKETWTNQRARLFLSGQ